MVAGKPPFQSTNHGQLISKILHLDLRPNPQAPQPRVGRAEGRSAVRICTADLRTQDSAVPHCRRIVYTSSAQMQLHCSVL